MIWYILISLFIALLLWTILGPVIIYLDTESNRYFLALPAVFKAAIVPSEDIVQIKGWVFFIPYKFNPFRGKKSKKKKEITKARPKKRSKRRSFSIGIMRDVIRSFRIRKLQMNIDTDDFLLNARLIPLFSMINSDNIQMQVNFEGNASLLLEIRTRIGLLIWALIRNKYKSLINN